MDELYKQSNKWHQELSLSYSHLGNLGKYIVIRINDRKAQSDIECSLNARELDDLMYELKFARRKLEES